MSQKPKSVLIVGALCSVIPDLDVIGFSLGIHYGDFWGHRGFTYSFVFAALLATAALLAFPGLPSGIRWPALWTFFFLAAVSHGLLDAITDGGLGVALLSPFDNWRYFFPWTPIRISPIGITRFFSVRGVAVLQSDFLWIWLPAIFVAVCAWLLRRQTPWRL